MPYKRNSDLPAQVRKDLPKHVEDIFREAFNSALDQYRSEQRAFRVAWAAVKRKYKKDSEGEWSAKGK